MKKFMAHLIILCSLWVIMGMGDLGGSTPGDKIPAPEKNFSAIAVDRDGIKTSRSQFSQDGKVVLVGKRGSGTITIPFDKISQIQFKSPEGSEIQAEIAFQNQKSLEMKLDKRSKFYGKTDFGT